MTEATRLLNAMGNGDKRAAEELLPLLYQELRQLARRKMAEERGAHTLQATALVHEAYLRMVGDGEREWDSRGHFFAAAAEAMRRILIESARRKKRLKRGGGQVLISLQDHDLGKSDSRDELLALDDALTKLSVEDPGAAELVKLHVFTGLSIDQVADAMGCSRATAYRNWSYARAWLRCELEGKGGTARIQGID
jgi:RNA polymerase sigma factor (TIGR02999 family)